MSRGAPTGAAQAAAYFHAVFARRPTVGARSPGRINLIGEHVDYQGGLVMPAAVDRHVAAAAAPNGSSRVRLASAQADAPPLEFELGALAPVAAAEPAAWANYVIGVVEQYRRSGADPAGFDIAFWADLPRGAGMSSSAALESATAVVVEQLAGAEVGAVERALMCQAAEHEFAGVPCGIMDQLAVNAGVAGHALMLDCHDLTFDTHPIPDAIAVVVVDSRVQHALADGAYAARRADCEAAAGALGVACLRDATAAQLEAAAAELDPQVLRRARHVLTEIARVRAFARALGANDLAQAGRLLHASHASLRGDFEVSCAELDALVEIAARHGAIGARMMGGGFGGSTINLVPAAGAGTFADAVCRDYRAQTSLDAEAIVVHAVDGAAAVAPG